MSTLPEGELGLFPEEVGPQKENSTAGAETSSGPAPLAARMRPRSLEEFRGQKRLLDQFVRLRTIRSEVSDIPPDTRLMLADQRRRVVRPPRGGFDAANRHGV